MSTTEEIRTYHQTIDFDSLMREARKHITALAGDLWTDHNSSDPGITQLEVLAFCIADLSYRTSFNVKDIVTGYKGGKSSPIDLPLADVVLPNNPVTVKDLRKALIDMTHPDDVGKPLATQRLIIRNAFPIIYEETEIEFYAVSKKGKESFLSFDTNYEEIYLDELANEISEQVHVPFEEQDGFKEAVKSIQPLKGLAATYEKEISLGRRVKEATPLQHLTAPTSAKAAHSDYAQDGQNDLAGIPKKRMKGYQFLDQIVLNGLYSLQIEFENQETETAPHLKDLNQNYFSQTLTAGGEDYKITVLFPYWDDINWDLRKAIPGAMSMSVRFAERSARNSDDFFIAVDKLNYDDYFYDYYSELFLDNYKINAFIKIEEHLRSKFTVNGVEYKFEINFLDWNEFSNGVKRNYTTTGAEDREIFPAVNNITPADLYLKRVDVEGENIMYDVTVDFGFKKFVKNSDLSITKKDKNAKLLTRIIFEDGTIILPDEEADVIAKILEDFQEFILDKIALENEIQAMLLDPAALIYQNYIDKLNAVFRFLYEHVHSIWSYLGDFRNVGEDFAKFSASRVQEIALFGKLIIAPNYNVNELLAEVYYQIDQFLSPIVQFNALSQMTAKGYSHQDLFNGPLLKHGFIENKDLDNLKRRSVIYTSDLIRIIMDIPGIEAVEGFSISSYIDNRLMGRNVINCLNLTDSDIYKPRFSSGKTKLNVCIDKKEQVLDKDAIELLEETYIVKKLAAKQAQKSGEPYLLDVPKGEDREIEAYYSIQNDFPEAYGIGAYGLPLDATEDRKGRAKQLKAFLLPFEQLLANYLKQIAHLPELFSFNRDIDQTYQYQPLYNVPDVEPLFAGFSSNQETWDSFKANLDNAYQTELKEGESKAEFRNRRSRFLSHLLARFGESFEEYATQMFDQHKGLLNDPINGITNYRAAQAETLDKIIDDKLDFAHDYERATAERYNAFNATKSPYIYYIDDTWSDANIGSYKVRLCRLLGIKQINNGYIFQTDVAGTLTDIEGMHIVEHILLRPRTTGAHLMALNNRSDLTSNGSFIYNSDKDPYSFRITIVLPKYAGRFSNEAFRTFTERLIRLETPAHILVDFKWMSGECGRNFEKKYAVWKTNIFRLKPYQFQSQKFIGKTTLDELYIIDKDSPIISPPRGDFSDDFPTDKDRKTILDLQDELTDALFSTCSLNLKLYNDKNIKFNAVNGVISFSEGTNDVFNFQVNQLEGTLLIYKLNSTTNKYDQEFELKPVQQNRISIDTITGLSTGMTTQLGGRGKYRVEYKLDGFNPIIKYIAVTKAIVPVHIYIGNDMIMYAFDTEQDGVFKISNKTWRSHFLFFTPQKTFETGEIFDTYGFAMISAPSKGLLPTPIGGKKAKSLFFHDIYQQYGAGKYHITYELDGQTTFVDLELCVELCINVAIGEQQLTPNGANVINIPAGAQIIDVELDLPFGTLKVYDLDAVSTISSVAIKDEKIAPKGLIDDNPFGTVDFYKKANQITINRGEKLVYQEGHHYLFLYELDGMQTEVTLYFEKEIVLPVIAPTVELLKNGVLMEGAQPFKLNALDTKNKYTLRFNPEGSNVEAGRIEADGSESILEAFTVPADRHLLELELGDMHRENRTAPLFIRNSNVAGTAYLQFSLYVEQDATPLTIAIYENGKPLENSENFLLPQQNEYAFKLNEKGGNIEVKSAKGVVVLTQTNIQELTLWFNGVEMYQKSGEKNFTATYTLSTEASIDFTLGIKEDPEPIIPAVTVTDLSTGIEVEKNLGAYFLVFDYQQPEQLFEFKFGNEFISAKERHAVGPVNVETELPIEDGLIRFNRSDVAPYGLIRGNHIIDCVFETGLLRVTVIVSSIDPTFNLIDVTGEGRFYRAFGNPIGTSGSYEWKVNGSFVSRDKNPQLTLDFRSQELITVSLTVNYNPSTATHEINLTEEVLQNLRIAANVPPILSMYQSDIIYDSSPALIQTENGSYGLEVSKAGGTLTVVNDAQEELVRIDEVEALKTLLDEYGLGRKGQENRFAAKYTLDGNEVTFEFELIIPGDPIVEEVVEIAPTITIKDRATGQIMEGKFGIYNLVYDYKNPEQFFELTFSNERTLQGVLRLLDEDGFETTIVVESGAVNFNGTTELPSGLISGNYNGTFEPQNGTDTIEFELNVINIDPTFELKELAFDGEVYSMVGKCLRPTGRTYIWRLNGEYVSRAKSPKLKVDFSKTEEVEVNLTVHYEDYEATSVQVITKEIFMKGDLS